MLGERSTDDINLIVGTVEKNFSVNFSMAKTRFCLSLHNNCDNSNLFVKGKEICKLKADNKSANFPTKLCLGSIFEKFAAVGSKEVYFKEIYMILQSIVMLLINLTF